MKTYKVYASVTATARHTCDCDCCRLARFITVRAIYEHTVQALDEAEAEDQAWAGLTTELEDATPRGYLTDIADEHVTVDVFEVSDVILANYPRLEGL